MCGKHCICCNLPHGILSKSKRYILVPIKHPDDVWRCIELDLDLVSKIQNGFKAIQHRSWCIGWKVSMPKLSYFSVSEFFALMAILSANFSSDTVVFGCFTWTLGTDDRRFTEDYRVQWLKHNQHCTDFTHPIVGGWVREFAILHDDPTGEQFLIDRMYAGN